MGHFLSWKIYSLAKITSGTLDGDSHALGSHINVIQAMKFFICLQSSLSSKKGPFAQILRNYQR